MTAGRLQRRPTWTADDNHFAGVWKQRFLPCVTDPITDFHLICLEKCPHQATLPFLFGIFCGAVKSISSGGIVMSAGLDYILHGRRKALEDAFFLERDKKLIQQMKEMKKMEETRENLSKVSGITNQHLLQKLVDLKVSAETVASISVVPLVEVAWADGKVDEEEKGVILSALISMNFKKGGIDYALVEQWLAHQPPAELLTAWTEYVQGLCQALPVKDREALKKNIMHHAHAVAEAMGGFLGLTSRVSKEEKAMLKKLEQAFEVNLEQKG
ncbi:MAG: hypothetical protein NTV49_14960 [Kiritimatiellaeota bacterium]|nr:hypothetical protein [Kiritimatiellota bacterium]